MKVMMIKSAKGISREDGAQTMTYEASTEYTADSDWQARVLMGFVKNGMAHAIGGNAAPTETKVGRKRKTSK
jgi:hypothetical protein